VLINRSNADHRPAPRRGGPSENSILPHGILYRAGIAVPPSLLFLSLSGQHGHPA
jgi:hypothetical protein